MASSPKRQGCLPATVLDEDTDRPGSGSMFIVEGDARSAELWLLAPCCRPQVAALVPMGMTGRVGVTLDGKPDRMIEISEGTLRLKLTPPDQAVAAGSSTPRLWHGSSKVGSQEFGDHLVRAAVILTCCCHFLSRFSFSLTRKGGSSRIGDRSQVIIISLAKGSRPWIWDRLDSRTLAVGWHAVPPQRRFAR